MPSRSTIPKREEEDLPPLDPAVVELGKALARAQAKRDHELVTPSLRRGLSFDQAVAALGLSPMQFKFHSWGGRIVPPRVVDGINIWDSKELKLCGPGTYPRQAPLPGVYVIGCASFVKIGVSRDIPRRLIEIQDGLPDEIVVHVLLPGDRRLEERLHKRFKAVRTRGEWFRLEGELKLWIEQGCESP